MAETTTPTPEQRFWAKVDKSAGCWLWTGARSRRGYGQFGFHGKTVYAHRLALKLVGREPGTVVDHICHNTSCVRPSHLRSTTHKQNLENRRGANRNSKSGIQGVSWHAFNQRWVASVIHDGEQHRRGFKNLEDAAEWVRNKRLELFTHNDADRL